MRLITNPMHGFFSSERGATTAGISQLLFKGLSLTRCRFISDVIMSSLDQAVVHAHLQHNYRNEACADVLPEELSIPLTAGT